MCSNCGLRDYVQCRRWTFTRGWTLGRWQQLLLGRVSATTFGRVSDAVGVIRVPEEQRLELLSVLFDEAYA